MDRYLIVSTDGHAGLPMEGYRDYLDAKYHAAFDEALPIQRQMTRKAEERFLAGRAFAQGGDHKKALECLQNLISLPPVMRRLSIRWHM